MLYLCIDFSYHPFTMNFQQLSYILAVDQHRHFAQAAEACHVSQPTLSMMVRRLEEELETQIFDRSRQPVVPTTQGEAIIAQARIILREKQVLTDLVQQAKGKPQGPLAVGIIPTLAPYLVPRFIRDFLQAYPRIQLKLTELRTETIVERLKQGELDAGILVTPLEDAAIHEYHLFYEELFAYTSTPTDKEFFLPEDIDPKQLWLLEEGHCFRSQIMNLCALQRKARSQFAYQAGSIETLKRLVQQQQGVTILPELCVLDITAEERARVKPFAEPVPVRQVSLVTHRPGLKARLTRALADTIQAAVPSHMLQRETVQVVEL